MKFPEPQPYLTEGGRIIYNEICKHLSDVDALESVDSYGLSMASHWLWMYHHAADAVKGNGGIQVTANGYSQVTAEVTIMKTASAIFEKLSSKFGLSNKDRELMMKFKGHKQVTDSLDEI